MKFTSTREGRSRYFWVDNVQVAWSISKKEFFCTVKRGIPSTIRDKIKVSHRYEWDHCGLVCILGAGLYDASDWVIPRKDRPDLTYGYPGRKLTLKEVRDRIKEALKS